jgi:hypothetical protein
MGSSEVVAWVVEAEGAEYWGGMMGKDWKKPDVRDEGWRVGEGIVLLKELSFCKEELGW